MTDKVPILPLPDPRDEMAGLRARLRASPAWRERLRSLMESLITPEEAETVTACEVHAPDLEAYAGDLARGVDTAAPRPELMAHLHTCARCKEDLVILTESYADAPGSGISAEPVAGAPAFLRSVREPVQIVPRTQLLRPGRGLLVRFNPAFLASRFQQTAALVLRGSGDETSPVVLLAEPREVEAQTWHLRVQATPADTPERMMLCAELMREPQPRLRVNLQWGETTLTRECDAEGRVCFENLPAAVVQEHQPRISLDIEALND